MWMPEFHQPPHRLPLYNKYCPTRSQNGRIIDAEVDSILDKFASVMRVYGFQNTPPVNSIYYRDKIINNIIIYTDAAFFCIISEKNEKYNEIFVFEG